MNRNILKYIIFFGASLILVFIDQFTKLLAYTKLYNKPPYVVIDGVIEFLYTENEGAAFGILQKKQLLFYVLTVIVIGVILYSLSKCNLTKHNIPYFVTLILIFSGAIGNFIDRIKNKYVIDFIYFKPINFPVFNFADICITLALIILIISTFTIYKD